MMHDFDISRAIARSSFLRVSLLECPFTRDVNILFVAYARECFHTSPRGGGYKLRREDHARRVI